MNLSFLHVNKCVVIKVAAVSTKENYLIVESGGTTYGGELVHGFKPPESIHKPGWCVMDYPFQWYIEVGISRLLLC